jgi:sugar/nucleoside kinase (ribokinase family)
LLLVDHLPAEEEVERALGGVVQGGGPVATALVALARLGARVAMLDAVGDDWRGRLIQEEFQAEGVETRFLVGRPGSTSATACILVREGSGSRTIVRQPGTASEVEPRELPAEAIRSASILHVNGRHLRACLEAVRLAREGGVRVSFDGGAGRYREELRPLVRQSDVCIVARDFASRYTGRDEPVAAGPELLGEGPSLVVVTDGRRGSWICAREGRPFHQPAFDAPRVVDTTGCGDAYHGAFLFGLLRGMDLEATAALASAVAALNATALGGRTALPRWEQAAAFLAASRGGPGSSAKQEPGPTR